MPLQSLRRIQFGLETVQGTPVAATKRMSRGTLRVTPSPELWSPEDEERGNLAAVRQRVTVANGVKMKYEGPVTFEQVINFLSIGLKGGITPSTPGGGTLSRDHVYTPSLTAASTLQSLTVEYGDDQQAYMAPFMVATNLQFTMALNAPWMMSVDLIGWGEIKQAFTGSLTETTVEEALGRMTTIAIDTSWANLGVTPKSTLLANAAIRFPDFYKPVKYADGALNFSDMRIQRLAAEVELTYRHEAQGVTEYDAYRADGGTARFIRLQTLGTLIEGALNKRIQFDFALKYTQAPELFAEVDGENYVRLVGRTFPDASNNWLSVAVRNAITALPA